MEGLVLLLGDWVARAGPLVLLPLGAGLFLVLSALLWIFVRAFRPRWGRRGLRRLGIIGVIGSVALGGLGVLATTAFFEPLLRWTLGRVEASSGVQAGFADADGNLFAGSANVQQLVARRPTGDVSRLDFTAGEAHIDVALLPLLWGERRLQEVRVSGLDGTYERVGDPPQLPESGDYAISLLDVHDSTLRFVDRRGLVPRTIELGIESLRCEDFTRDRAVFDLLFRCNAGGRLNGQPYALEATSDGHTHQTSWRVQSLPVLVLGELLGGPIAHFTEGLVDLEVDSEWMDGSEDLHMRWAFTLRSLGLSPEVRNDPRLPDFVARLLEWTASRDVLRLEVPLRMRLSDFDRASSIQGAGLGRAVGAGLLRALLDMSPIPGLTGDLLESEAVRGFLDDPVGTARELLPDAVNDFLDR